MARVTAGSLGAMYLVFVPVLIMLALARRHEQRFVRWLRESSLASNRLGLLHSMGRRPYEGGANEVLQDALELGHASEDANPKLRTVAQSENTSAMDTTDAETLVSQSETSAFPVYSDEDAENQPSSVLAWKQESPGERVRIDSPEDMCGTSRYLRETVMASQS